MYYVKGLGTGMVAGLGLAVAVKCVCKENKKLTKKTGRTAKQISDIMSSITEILG
jgi:hypothetical protein